MKRAFAFLLSAALATSAFAAVDPRTIPTQLPPAWQMKTREVFKQAIEIPSVHNRGETHRVAELLAGQFRAAGIPDSDIHIMPYEALPHHGCTDALNHVIAASARSAAAANIRSRRQRSSSPIAPA